MGDLRLVRADNPAAEPLLEGLRQEYHTRYGSSLPTDIGRYAVTEFLPPTGAFVIVEARGVTVAGGALRKLTDGIGEIKRMWTDPAHRGRGHARRVLTALEDAAVRQGYRSLQLVTGAMNSAAIALYSSVGYRETAPYGYHGADPRFLSLEKHLRIS
jgi:ribosomal protein S18 acetylase RimI-like enzyme